MKWTVKFCVVKPKCRIFLSLKNFIGEESGVVFFLCFCINHTYFASLNRFAIFEPLRHFEASRIGTPFSLCPGFYSFIACICNIRPKFTAENYVRQVHIPRTGAKILFEGETPCHLPENVLKFGLMLPGNKI